MISKDLEVTLNAALGEARKRRHEYLCVEHLLYALLDDAYGREILQKCGVHVPSLRDNLDKFFDAELESAPQGSQPFLEQTASFERLLQRAFMQVQYSGKKEVDAGDILAAIFEEKDSHAAYYLKQEGLTRLDVLNYVSHGVSKDALDTGPEDLDALDADEYDEEEEERRKSRNPLDAFTVNLAQKAADGRIDPLIGRAMELRRTIRILCRRQKNNPVFVGEPGVGKTHLAEGLALKIHQNEVPEPLKNVEIRSLDLPALLAGTKFRGDFEARLKAVINELVKRRDIVLYIDEIHTVVGAGATADSSMDASSILKPVLASGEVRCIGSTTYEEYKNHFEKDRALSRRFQKVDILEPSVEETLRILRGLKTRFEKHHGITYTDTALQAAAELTAKHINDRFLPDKAIDVIDEAGANVRLEEPDRKTIRPLDIEKIVAEIARIPARSVSSSDKEKLGMLDTELKRAVFGQDEAIGQIVRSIRRSRAGLGRADKPVGCFLFTGPTGVGKTEVAKQLAETLGVHFARYDMSEYMEKHAVSRLIGAPPGYVGFDQGGLLVDEIRRNPYTVLLLDELEKAHPDIFGILLQVMDSAALTDNTGKKADFRNVILIMTSNAGARELAAKSIGFKAGDDEAHHKSLRAVEKAFTPEFRNRLDAIVTFNPLPMLVIEQIVDKFIRETQRKLEPHKVKLTLTEGARRWLADHGYDDKMGARPLGRLIQQEVETPLSDELLFGRLEKGGNVTVDVKDGKVVFDYGEMALPA
ncbi:MAG: ATP-dependent Clp protease ATP-binding subunit ClpA [Candidatus Hydrogenedentes bacterium]|nr:ATP-dependent Clp protease ATP-binding subunit ClpA [Candidatus Hydrogenedentota bacterium]